MSDLNVSSRFVHYSAVFAVFLGFLGLIGFMQVNQGSAGDDLAKEVGFVSHKALYEISLAGTKSGSQILNISGQMYYGWEPTCDAWISDHRFNLNYEYADAPAMNITSDFAVYESFDGKSMSFSSQRKRNGELFEELRGNAVRNEDGSGEVTYSLPEGLTFDLPKNTQFPMGHSLEILKQLKAGKKFYKAKIFDGSDGEGPVEVNAFIGKPANAWANMEASPNIAMALLNVPARHVRLAFFPLEDGSGESEYEMSVVFHDNGVISDMFIEYDDFSVRQRLVALEALPPQACGTEDKKN